MNTIKINIDNYNITQLRRSWRKEHLDLIEQHVSGGCELNLLNDLNFDMEDGFVSFSQEHPDCIFLGKNEDGSDSFKIRLNCVKARKDNKELDSYIKQWNIYYKELEIIINRSITPLRSYLQGQIDLCKDEDLDIESKRQHLIEDHIACCNRSLSIPAFVFEHCLKKEYARHEDLLHNMYPFSDMPEIEYWSEAALSKLVIAKSREIDESN